ncbi:MAG: hypothetical protein ABEI86_14115, partial [Halobacteriaceae archaeon]
MSGSGSREIAREILQEIAENEDFWREEEVQRLLKIAASADNPGLLERIHRLLSIKGVKYWKYPFSPVPPNTNPGVRLGRTKDSSQIRIDLDSVSRHILSVGQSGAGKTTLFYNLLGQIEVPFWVFDLKKDYRHLIQDQND